jgi:hypothetical protein
MRIQDPDGKFSDLGTGIEKIRNQDPGCTFRVHNTAFDLPCIRQEF